MTRDIFSTEENASLTNTLKCNPDPDKYELETHLKNEGAEHQLRRCPSQSD